jgi:hypothetical protein
MVAEVTRNYNDIVAMRVVDQFVKASRLPRNEHRTVLTVQIGNARGRITWDRAADQYTVSL